MLTQVYRVSPCIYRSFNKIIDSEKKDRDFAQAHRQHHAHLCVPALLPVCTSVTTCVYQSNSVFAEVKKWFHSCFYRKECTQDEQGHRTAVDSARTGPAVGRVNSQLIVRSTFHRRLHLSEFDRLGGVSRQSTLEFEF